MKKLKLYKYRSINPHEPEKDINRILSILQGKLHFADWRDCNDPMEGYFQFYGDSDDTRDIDQIINDKGQLKICALSKTATNILMWSHYANGHQGVCIEIECGEFSYSENDDTYFRSERTNENAPFIKEIKYARSLYDIFEGDYHKRTAVDILSRKIDTWKYEEEYRAFYRSEQGTQIAVGTVTKVIAGVRSNKQIIDKIKSDSPAHIDFVNTKIDFTKNKILCT
jgi:hypothetical protein